MAMDTTSKKKPNNTICLRRKRLERSRSALSRHSVEPTILENKKNDSKDKLTSLVGKIRYAQNRTHKPTANSGAIDNQEDKPLWEID